MNKSASIGWPWPTYPELEKCWYICTICWECEITLEKHVEHRQKLHRIQEGKNVFASLTDGLAAFLDTARTVYHKLQNEDSEIGRVYRKRLRGESSSKLAVGVLDDGSRIYEIDAAGHVTPIAAPGCFGLFERSQEENLREVLDRIRSSAEIIAAFEAEHTSNGSCGEDQKPLLQKTQVIHLIDLTESEDKEIKEEPGLREEPICSTTFMDFLEDSPCRSIVPQPQHQVTSQPKTEVVEELQEPISSMQGSRPIVEPLEPVAEPRPESSSQPSNCKIDWKINPVVKLIFANTFNVAKGSIVNLPTGPVKIRHRCKHPMKKTAETTIGTFPQVGDLTMETSNEADSETILSLEEALRACQAIPDQNTWIYDRYGNRLNKPGAPVIRPIGKSGVVRKNKVKRKFFDLVPIQKEPAKPKEKRRATELSRLTTDEKLLELILCDKRRYC